MELTVYTSHFGKIYQVKNSSKFMNGRITSAINRLVTLTTNVMGYLYNIFRKEA
jgi:hypothetical protein